MGRKSDRYGGLVGENERDGGLVVGVLEDLVRDLEHRRDAGATRDHANVLLHVRLVLNLGDRALHRKLEHTSVKIENDSGKVTRKGRI